MATRLQRGSEVREASCAEPWTERIHGVRWRSLQVREAGDLTGTAMGLTVAQDPSTGTAVYPGRKKRRGTRVPAIAQPWRTTGARGSSSAYIKILHVKR